MAACHAFSLRWPRLLPCAPFQVTGHTCATNATSPYVCLIRGMCLPFPYTSRSEVVPHNSRHLLQWSLHSHHTASVPGCRPGARASLRTSESGRSAAVRGVEWSAATLFVVWWRGPPPPRSTLPRTAYSAMGCRPTFSVVDAWKCDYTCTLALSATARVSHGGLMRRCQSSHSAGCMKVHQVHCGGLQSLLSTASMLVHSCLSTPVKRLLIHSRSPTPGGASHYPPPYCPSTCPWYRVTSRHPLATSPRVIPSRHPVPPLVTGHPW